MAKTIIIGVNHAGTAAANTLLGNYPGHEVVIFDPNERTSYLGCGTALYIGKQIAGTDGLFYSSKEALESQGAQVNMQTTVTGVDFDRRVVTARTIEGRVIEETYDTLIFATGSSPITPPIPGTDLDGVHFVKTYNDGQVIDRKLSDARIKSVAVIGAGYIGVEMAEAAKRRGRNTMLVEVQGQSLTGYFDKDFTSGIDAALRGGGVDLHYGEQLLEIKGDEEGRVRAIVTDKGEFNVEMVVLSVGFRPNTELANGLLELGEGGAFKVNLNQQTSRPEVFAAGDCATVYNNATGATDYIALATNAVRSGIVAGHNAGGTPLQSAGVQGSNGICIWDYKMFSTGLTVEKAKEKGIDVGFSDVEDLQKPAFMADNDTVKLRVVYDNESRRIIGAQLASHRDVSLGIHLFSLAIAKGVTINELPLVDIFFMPHFNQPFNYITMAGLTAK
ncbi:MAG: FAD-dependent oxidoreductase [Promicromonosporaceae bacterium]|nr:FAD-dependent oxidoreductase [Promicromonosporaceae bacterium]